MSDKAAENVPTDCFLRVASADMVNQLFLSASRVANSLFLTVVDEQISDAKGSSHLRTLVILPGPL